VNVFKLGKCLTSICAQSFEDYFYMVNGLSRLLQDQMTHFCLIVSVSLMKSFPVAKKRFGLTFDLFSSSNVLQKEEALLLVQKEQPDLFAHLAKFSLDKIIHDLLYSCFAEALDVPLIIKVWDKVIGGYFRQIMPKLTAAYFVALKDNLLQAADQQQFESYLNQVRQFNSVLADFTANPLRSLFHFFDFLTNSHLLRTKMTSLLTTFDSIRVARNYSL
jgi:hypothetical protein